LTGLHQLLHLAAAQMQSILPVPYRAAERECVAVRFDPPAQAFIPRDPSQFDQRLPFEWCRLPVYTVVIPEFIEWNRPRTGITVRPQPEVNAKKPLCASFNEVDRLSRQ